jgi:exodeoxyribonuclease VII large subunit
VPQRIGLVASVESAGYADFTKILNARWGGVDVTVADVLVQGVDAPRQIIGAIQHFNEQSEPVEALVVVRGGGSAEDLSVFNDEPLVRAVAASRIPTMVGVGHEIDTSLSDLAADVRAATPSNAAQLLVPDRQAIISELHHKNRHMLTRLGARREQILHQVSTTVERLLGRMRHKLETQARHVQYARQTLRQLDPKVVLRRGYALVRDERGNIAKSTELQPGDVIAIELDKSIIKAGMQDVRKKT